MCRYTITCLVTLLQIWSATETYLHMYIYAYIRSDKPGRHVLKRIMVTTFPCRITQYVVWDLGVLLDEKLSNEVMSTLFAGPAFTTHVRSESYNKIYHLMPL